MGYLEIVQELNSELYDNHRYEGEQFFYTANGFVDIIGFGNILLWHSEDDDRERVEEENDYEPMKPFIKRKLRDYAKNLTKLSK